MDSQGSQRAEHSGGVYSQHDSARHHFTETLDEILATTNKVAEGVWTTRAVLERARELGVEMPIAEEVGRVLFEEEPVESAVRSLMSRLLREESAWGED